ncbi:MAG: hypothetical protein GTO03_17655, partial [Planctomycetales bacterium]|nr:hypothetical protein [Planctomycetales bacterium]
LAETETVFLLTAGLFPRRLLVLDKQSLAARHAAARHPWQRVFRVMG